MRRRTIISYDEAPRDSPFSANFETGPPCGYIEYVFLPRGGTAFDSGNSSCSGPAAAESDVVARRRNSTNNSQFTHQHIDVARLLYSSR